jgi:hypothetical protein
VPEGHAEALIHQIDEGLRHRPVHLRAVHLLVQRGGS